MTARDCAMALLNQADFDGELDAARSAEIAAHRETCAACRAAYDEMTALRAMARAEGLTFAAPAALGVRYVRARGPARSAWLRGGGIGFALGAAAAAVLFFAVQTPAPDSADWIAQAVDDHVRSLQPGHLEDVVSTDKHTVKPWFDGRIDFAPPVKDLAAQQFPLKGGRLDYLYGQSAAALVYEHGKHAINLFVRPVRAADSAPATGGRSGYNLVRWTEHGMGFVAVSDLEADQLADFVARWRAEP